MNIIDTLDTPQLYVEAFTDSNDQFAFYAGTYRGTETDDLFMIVNMLNADPIAKLLFINKVMAHVGIS